MSNRLNNSSDPNSGGSFFDRNTILAFIIITVFWIGWNRYLEYKYPQTSSQANLQTTNTSNPSGQSSSVPALSNPTSSSIQEQSPIDQNPSLAKENHSPVTQQESIFEFNDTPLSFQISSYGMGIKNINVKNFKTRENQDILLANINNSYPFSTELLTSDSGNINNSIINNNLVNFNINKTDSKNFIGTADIGNLRVIKRLHVEPEKYQLTFDVEVQNIRSSDGVSEAPPVSVTDSGFRGLKTLLSDHGLDYSKASATHDEMQEFVYLSSGSRNQTSVSSDKADQVSADLVKWAALSSHYFTLALIDKSPVLPRLTAAWPASNKHDVLRGEIIYQPQGLSSADKGSIFHVQYDAYVGPKLKSTLEQVDPELSNVISYGKFSWIAFPLLALLKFFYSIVQNYGVAIILLTLLVRLLVLPFNIMSYRSMKVMQKIQPQMQAIREKYKDDPATMNREVMDLMKKNNANPLGGCLPMLLQLPVFLALYQVLGQSIELYRSPFMLWIQDLSAKDPFYILPVLMGATMFVQQKITPNPSMDPSQDKVMLWMPVIFSFFMVNLPSGLTLYIFVSTLFGVGQQYYFTRVNN